MNEKERSLLCPSAVPSLGKTSVFAIINNQRPHSQLMYLDTPVATNEEVLGLTGGEAPTSVFRFTAPCRQSACSHFISGGCRLTDAITDLYPVVAEAPLPDCSIRASCRWYAQIGADACHRCQYIVTSDVAVEEDVWHSK